MKYFKKLIGEKVYLSPMCMDDAETYAKWLNDLEISMKLLDPSDILSLEKQKEALEDLIKNQKNFSVINLSNDELLGSAGFSNINLVNKYAEIGLFIGNREYWNKGYGADVIELLLNYGFNILNLNNIMLNVREYNKPAIRCYEKCGFKEIGRRREAIIFGDKKYDIIYMDILASEFETDINDLLEGDGFRL